MVKKKVKKNENRKKSRSQVKYPAPVLVKVISVLYYIAAILFMIIGIILFIGGIIGNTFIEQFNLDIILESGNVKSAFDAFILPLILGSLVIGGILVIAIGILDFYIARGLWLGQNWARIVATIFAVGGFVFALLNFEPFSLIINAVIGIYLWFSNQARRTFSK